MGVERPMVVYVAGEVGRAAFDRDWVLVRWWFLSRTFPNDPPLIIQECNLRNERGKTGVRAKSSPKIEISRCSC